MAEKSLGLWDLSRLGYDYVKGVTLYDGEWISSQAKWSGKEGIMLRGSWGEIRFLGTHGGRPWLSGQMQV